DPEPGQITFIAPTLRADDEPAQSCAAAALVPGPREERLDTAEHRAPKRGRNAVERGGEVDGVVTLVSGEQLVAPIAGERHRDKVARELRQVVRRNRRGIRVGLAIVPR